MRPPGGVPRSIACTPAESPPWSNRLVNGTLVALVLVSVVAAVVETLASSLRGSAGSSAWSRRSPWR